MSYETLVKIHSFDYGPRFALFSWTSSDGLTQYVAEANPGTSQASALWRVKKIVTSTDGSNNTTQIITWADGNDNFDNVASSYASLTYQ